MIAEKHNLFFSVLSSMWNYLALCDVRYIQVIPPACSIRTLSCRTSCVRTSNLLAFKAKLCYPAQLATGLAKP